MNVRLMAEVGERTSELKQSLADLKATQVQLIQQEKMASLGQLTAGIALYHELEAQADRLRSNVQCSPRHEEGGMRDV